MSTAVGTITLPDFTVEHSAEWGGYVVRNNLTNTLLTDRFGAVRVFSTPNTARKRISRERSGNFHK